MKTVAKILGGLGLAVAQVVAQDSTPIATPPASPSPANAAQPQIARELPVAHPISTVDPKYPKEARKQRRQGLVVLRVRIGEDGKVKDLSVVSGDPDLCCVGHSGGQEMALSALLGGRKAD